MAKKKWYGDIGNRINEGKNFTGRELQEGDDITMFYWSDRKCYFITKVIDQKHIMVKKYHVCADHSKPGGMGHQNWLYFKTGKEMAKYFDKIFPEDAPHSECEYGEEEWVFKNNKWKSVDRWNLGTIEEFDLRNGYTPYFTEKEMAKINSGKDVCKYHKLEPISFGVKDCYYDWEF